MTHPHPPHTPRTSKGRVAAHAAARLVGGSGLSAYGLVGVVGAVLVLFALAATPAFAAEACLNQELRQQQRSTGLPDCRAYEMVSPPGKNGLDVTQQTNKTHVASDGNAVTFAALGGFGALQGTSFDAEYLSRRNGAPGTNGWSTHGINPPEGSDTFPAAGFGNTPSFVDAFTPDLSAAIYQAWYPLTNAPNVAEVANLYRIDGLGGGGETAQLMSDGVAALPSAWPTALKVLIQPRIAGASSDLGHVAFESTLALTADAPPYQGLCAALGLPQFCPTQLYENAGGTVRLVGRIPNAPETACDDVNGPACVSADSSQAGISASLQSYSQRMISADGRRIFFQVPAGADSGAIYIREDATRTVQLAHEGQLWDASPDGSRVYFITSESLLPGDTDSNRDLYLYDANAPGNHLTLISASTVNAGTVETVVGTSDDGHYVYFVCDGQLVAGEPAFDVAGLYVWHDGTLAYIGQLRAIGEAHLNGPRTQWSFPSTMSTSRVTPDGRHLLFMTQSDAGFRGREGFAGYDHGEPGRQELYLYSADTNRLVCASCNPTGRAATIDALTNVVDGVAVSASTSDLSHALSDDGQHVFFSSAEALSPADTNGVSDAYEYDTATATVHLLSSGSDPSPSYVIDASNDGKDAFIATRQQLLGWDVDNSYDLYDVRVGGGFPEPLAPAPACSGEACLPQNAQAPASPAPSSATLNGAGNLPSATATTPPNVKPKPHRRCPRNTIARRIKGHTRCLHRSHRHAQRTRAAIHNNGSGR